VRTVGAQVHPVFWPESSISIVLPAWLESTRPLNRIWLFRKPAAIVVMVVPPVLALTRPVGGLPGLLEDPLEPDEEDELTWSPPPPDAARPMAGSDSRLARAESSTTTCAFPRRVKTGITPVLVGCLRGELTGSRC
jgi:hypothetical protein